MKPKSISSYDACLPVGCITNDGAMVTHKGEPPIPTMYIVAQDEIVIATDSRETRICYNFGAFTTRESAQKVANEQNAKIDAKESGMEDEGEYYVLGIPIKV